jgi:hypothetical protein
LLTSLYFLVFSTGLHGQVGTLTGSVKDKVTGEPISFANLAIEEIQITTTADINGQFKIEGIKPGIYTLFTSFVGYKKEVIYEIRIVSGKTTRLEIGMTPLVKELEEVIIQSSPFNKTAESPVSLKTISSTEILRNPGSNRDISKVVTNLPGVNSTLSFRNDLIVRGGAPGENRFFIEGIEIPNINHFATQGSSGGPVGMINVNFIREVDFFTGSFPVNLGNPLSSAMDISLVPMKKEKTGGSFMLGSSDLALSLDRIGSKKASFGFSVRRSYLQYLFSTLKLPFLPTYNDILLKGEIEINEKNKILILGLAAIDEFSLNQKVNEGISDPDVLKRNNYILNNIPVNTQWNYTTGIKWTNYRKNGPLNIIFSTNQLNNKSIKYRENEEKPENLILDYRSGEQEFKFRMEKYGYAGKLNFLYGGGIEQGIFTNNTQRFITIDTTSLREETSLRLSLFKYYAFGRVSSTFLKERLELSFSVRTDFSDYSATTLNPAENISPRTGISYTLTKKTTLNFSTGVYFQLPPYTVLGYTDSMGNLVNKSSRFIRSPQLAGGIDYSPNTFTKISVEGFFKQYSGYPFLLRDSISLSQLGADFGVIGNEPVAPIGEGRSYGLEFFYQRKFSKSWYGLLSYTFLISEFKTVTGNYAPTSWDVRHTLNASGGYRLKRGYEIGFRFRFLSGSPYTPIDFATSSVKEVWNVNYQGIPDWNRLNSLRLDPVHTLDLRIDKTWNLKKLSLNMYLDVQNVYNFKIETPHFVDTQKDSSGTPLTNPSDPDRYLLEKIPNTSGTILPSIGLMIEF